MLFQNHNPGAVIDNFSTLLERTVILSWVGKNGLSCPCQGKKLEINDKDALPFFICVKLLKIDSGSYILNSTHLSSRSAHMNKQYEAWGFIMKYLFTYLLFNVITDFNLVIFYDVFWSQLKLLSCKKLKN